MPYLMHKCHGYKCFIKCLIKIIGLKNNITSTYSNTPTCSYIMEYVYVYFPNITCLNLFNFAFVTGLVNTSAMFSSVGTYFKLTIPACISDLIK